MRFILFNKIFENIIIKLSTINSIILIIADISAEIRRIKKNKNEVKTEDKNNLKNKILKQKIVIIFLWLAISVITIIYFFIKNFGLRITVGIFEIITIITAIFFSIKNIIKNNNRFTLENNIVYTTASLSYIAISSSMTYSYIKIFQNIKHIYKELLLIFYLNLRVVLFTLFFIINLIIILKNIVIVLNKYNILEKLKKIIKFDTYTIYFYNYLLTNDRSKIVIADSIIAFLIAPFGLILSLLVIIPKYLLNKTIILLHNLIKNFGKVKKTFFNIIKASVIISLILTYIIITFNNFFISEKLKDVYNLIATVILIPIVFDSLNSHK